MPIEARRALRLALGLALAALLGWGQNWTMPHLVPLLAAALLVPPMPPPGLKQLLPLLLVMVLACGWGLLLAALLEHAPLPGFLVMIAGVGLAGTLGFRPGMAILATLFIMGDTLIAAVALQSSALAKGVVMVMLLGTVAAAVIAHIVHAMLPEAAAPPAPPAVPAAPAGWIGLRSALIMAPPVLLALTDPGSYLMILIKGAQLTQQASATAARGAARELAGSTAAGGAAALLFWSVLSIWPTLWLLTAGFALAGLAAGRQLYRAVPGRFGFGWWQNALTTMIIVIGPAIADSAGGDDVRTAMVTRTATYMVLALYAAGMVHLLDSRRTDRASA